MRLCGIARSEIDGRRLPEPGWQANVAVRSETGQAWVETGARGGSLKRCDEGMVGCNLRAVRVEDPLHADRMLSQVRVGLTERREMGLDLALHMPAQPKLVFLVWKILDVDHNLPASSRRG